MKVKRTQFVSTLWSRAITPNPTSCLSPKDFGWKFTESNLYIPIWFEGDNMPNLQNLFANENNSEDIEGSPESQNNTLLDEESCEEDVDEAWSESDED